MLILLIHIIIIIIIIVLHYYHCITLLSLYYIMIIVLIYTPRHRQLMKVLFRAGNVGVVRECGLWSTVVHIWPMHGVDASRMTVNLYIHVYACGQRCCLLHTHHNKRCVFIIKHRNIVIVSAYIIYIYIYMLYINTNRKLYRRIFFS